MGLITEQPDDTYYTVDPTLIGSLLAEAYVDAQWLAATVGVPYVRDFQPRNPPETPNEWFTRKWIQSASRTGTGRSSHPNHQTAFFGSRPGFAGLKGETQVSDGFNDAWVYLDTAPAGEAPELLAHEMGHQWRLNQTWRIPSPPAKQTTGGHCNTAVGKTVPKYGTDLLCLMTAGTIRFSSNPEASDGVAGFHYEIMGAVEDSEYLAIRLRAEPIPQNEIQGRQLQ